MIYFVSSQDCSAHHQPTSINLERDEPAQPSRNFKALFEPSFTGTIWRAIQDVRFNIQWCTMYVPSCTHLNYQTLQGKTHLGCFFWPSNSGILGVPKRSPNLAKMSAWSAWGIHVAGTTSERHRRSPDAPSNGSGPGPYRRGTQLSLQLAKPKRVTLNFSIFVGNYTDVTWPHLNWWFSRVNLQYLIKKTSSWKLYIKDPGPKFH